MRKQKPMQPIVITSHPMSYVLAAFLLLFSPVMLWMTFSQEDIGARLLCLAMALLSAGLGVVLFLIPRKLRITVSTEHVTIEQKRGGIHAELPWDSYRFAYRLSGYKVSYLLLTPGPLSKQGQYEAANACAKATKVPFVHDGCLALPANLYYSQILQRLPEHIRIAPEHECGTLRNKGRA